VPNNVKVESTKTKLPRNLPEKQNHNPKTKTTATNSLKPTIEKQNKDANKTVFNGKQNYYYNFFY
jgi:hypothetical protein